ncbi:hypothetical protein K461DRAFT_278486 [Myriangium duriaei CBS 260.36]|uniref:Protein with SprT-like domain at the N terminus n=1 Tax=Myriangium duriaei CBS 260.36 TaxID=1168546 RepID=A0A9P4MGM9_9PEZI|nr:hypothetical protein K461DRAFT_278486 [Myriangium duriaei CBS 260.36]
MDEGFALSAIQEIISPSTIQKQAQNDIQSVLSTDAPFVDIHQLFDLYDRLYFRSLLANRVEVTWSPRLTLCAGICELVKDNNGQYKRVRLKLSEPLLKFRPRSDVINTLLHESIHAYLFVTTSWKHSRGEDGTGHGKGFLLLADAINSHGGYQITVFHTFHDEVDSYRTHIWQCDGPCRTQPPFFGLVKRSTNRAPGKGDAWFSQHEQECGGKWLKIAEPEMSKEQVARLSGLQRAGLQKNKLDSWVGSSSQKSKRVAADDVGKDGIKKQKYRPEIDGRVECPICAEMVMPEAINRHLDEQHM